ncbi:hypothetical protein CYMTET_9519 [Cymbomonas tetramitiformis]|uniref:Uncharacterized protein n=1 Tax=Cymbomonas tetramitiformis TaxID=36881 RepID=A0AAE0GQY1_9CHLO|nr:hypothetical protein CYMTET_9519 [Cymbomonas tetramitiformis]
MLQRMYDQKAKIKGRPNFKAIKGGWIRVLNTPRPNLWRAMKLTSTCRLALTLLIVCKAIAASSAETNDESADEEVKVSIECGAVLYIAAGAGGTIAATAAASALPLVLCSTSGFCAVGVAAGSHAARWQATLPLIAKGSVFASLQSIAMGGTSTGTVLVSGALGALGGASFLRSFCEEIDAVDPDSKTGSLIRGIVEAARVSSNGIETVKLHAEHAMNAAFQAATNTWNFAKAKIDEVVDEMEKRKAERAARAAGWVPHVRSQLKILIAEEMESYSVYKSMRYNTIREVDQCLAGRSRDADAATRFRESPGSFLLDEYTKAFTACIAKHPYEDQGVGLQLL